ncbi:MAG: hypothetical protein ABIC04_04210 [Nanoarchaeota archaeon]
MKILQIEDSPEYIKKTRQICTEKNHVLHTFSNFFDAVDPLSKDYDLYILDGCFPLKPDMQSDANFSLIIEYLKILERFDKTKILAWSNSTRVQKYCLDNSLQIFRKSDYDNEDKKKLEVMGMSPVKAADIGEIIK